MLKIAKIPTVIGVLFKNIYLELKKPENFIVGFPYTARGRQPGLILMMQASIVKRKIPFNHLSTLQMYEVILWWFPGLKK